MITRRNFLGKTGALSAAIATGLVATPGLADEMGVSRKGMFEGRSNHVTSGTVKIIEKDGRRFVELGEDFSLDNGPDPRVGFGVDGEYRKESHLGALLELAGKQRYAVPTTMDIDGFNEVYIWCEVAGVPLGVASLK